MFDLFGTEMPLPAKFFIAFAAVLALIGLTAWVVRRIGANRLGGAGARGRQPRLAVIDAATVDGRRRLVLIRRDNVEHLVLIGGPTDIVVEQNIVRATPSRDGAREVPRETTRETVKETPRVEPPARQVESSFPLQPISEQATVPTPRPYRAAVTEEPWHAPEPGARARPSTAEPNLSGLAADMASRHAALELAPSVAPSMAPSVTPPVAPPRSAAPAAPTVSHEPGAAPQTDQNLADMAQQLEAALRRAPVPEAKSEARPPVTDALAAQPAPVKPIEPPRRDYKLRVDPRIADATPEPKVEPKVDTKSDFKDEAWPEPAFDIPPFKADAKTEPKFDAMPAGKTEPKFDMPPEPRFERPAPKPAAAPGKTVYDSLEEEMASLLGRPPGKT